LVGTTNYTGAINPSSFAVNIGKCTYSQVGGDRAFDGKMDEIRIWNTALSQSTIRGWMCAKLNSSHPNYNNLKGYWRFDEGTGTTTSDLSGNSNTGTLMGGATWELSAAPLGDTCTYSTSTPIVLTLTYQNQDSVLINNVTGNPDVVYLYRVDQSPNLITPPANFEGLDTTHYYGVFISGTATSNYNVIYFYGNNPVVSHCGLDILRRSNNTSTSWTASMAILNPTAQTLSGTLTSNKEFLTGYFDIASAYTNDPLSFCDGDSAVIFADSASYYTYQWLLNGNPVPGANDYYYVVKSAGDYSVIVGSGICADTSQTIAFLVDPIPPTPVITEVNDTLFSSSPSGNQWYDDNGYLPGITGTYFAPPVQGHYYVIVSSPVGCKSDTSNIIAFGYGSGINDFIKSNDLFVYPNPCKGECFLKHTLELPLQLFLYDQTGKTIFIRTLKPERRNKINLTGMQPGVYYLKVISKKKVWSTKIFKY